MQNWTIQKLLTWMTDYFAEKGIDAPRLSAEMLLSHVLCLTRIELYTRYDQAVEKPQLDRLRELTKRAANNEPIAYLTGKKEFYSIEFDLTPDCLIPRPETELLVERAIEFLRSRVAIEGAADDGLNRRQIPADAPVQFVCDLCTGCGCIAVAIAKNFPAAKLIATDICDRALAVAAKNIEKHNLGDRITLLHGDLFDPLISQLDTTKFDLLVSNPPYVSAAEFDGLEKNVKDYEPKIALYAGDDGLDVYRRIMEKVHSFLKPDAAMILEIGYAQGPRVKELIDQTGAFAEVKIEKDRQNNDRIVTAANTRA